MAPSARLRGCGLTGGRRQTARWVGSGRVERTEGEARRGERRRRRKTPCRFSGLSPAAAETGGGSPTDQHNAAGRQPDAVDLILSATRECEYAGRPLGRRTLSCRGAARRSAACTTARGALYYRRLACASCARGSERSAACLLTYVRVVSLRGDAAISSDDETTLKTFPGREIR